MKLMFCGSCGDVVSPGLKDNDPRWCSCGRHAVWWANGATGQLRVHDKLFPERNGSPGGRAWVIGLHNQILQFGGLTCDPHVVTKAETSPDGTVTTERGNLFTRKEWIEAMLEYTPSTYLFKRVNSMVVRFTPGYTNDTAWEAQVPDGSQRG